MKDKSIEQAVNQALNDLELTQNKSFTELMSALYAELEEAENSSHHDYVQIVEEVKSGIGEFVPV